MSAVAAPASEPSGRSSVESLSPVPALSAPPAGPGTDRRRSPAAQARRAQSPHARRHGLDGDETGLVHWLGTTTRSKQRTMRSGSPRRPSHRTPGTWRARRAGGVRPRRRRCGGNWPSTASTTSPLERPVATSANASSSCSMPFVGSIRPTKPMTIASGSIPSSRRVAARSSSPAGRNRSGPRRCGPRRSVRRSGLKPPPQCRRMVGHGKEAADPRVGGEHGRLRVSRRRRPRTSAFHPVRSDSGRQVEVGDDRYLLSGAESASSRITDVQVDVQRPPASASAVAVLRRTSRWSTPPLATARSDHRRARRRRGRPSRDCAIPPPCFRRASSPPPRSRWFATNPTVAISTPRRYRRPELTRRIRTTGRFCQFRSLMRRSDHPVDQPTFGSSPKATPLPPKPTYTRPGRSASPLTCSRRHTRRAGTERQASTWRRRRPSATGHAPDRARTALTHEDHCRSAFGQRSPNPKRRTSSMPGIFSHGVSPRSAERYRPSAPTPATSPGATRHGPQLAIDVAVVALRTAEK